MEKTSTHILLNAEGIGELVGQLAQAVFDSLPRQVPVGIIGIRRRGEVLAKRLAHELAFRGAQGVAIGSLDITLYRDDLAELGPQAIVRQTEIDFDIDGRYIVLVDDVLFTGRSVRAALDALIDLGRPKAIRLAVLVDRPGRELPIQADFVGLTVKQPGVSVTVLLTESDGVEEVRSE
ncbi:MAG: bifunctional pyr operon transcriptional regulator/uracil phosphoribosyltransferase PyrR [Phycisphaerae bacterium]|nr:bifunctional pyr operon transcriptional regulator/uracil phosphoribosyltransferase PyrR [Phycisphaerae bacterium]